jgi:hypothetical protein
MIFEIDDIASVGSVSDIPGYQLPPESWTLALNMRYRDNALESLSGWTQIFGTPLYPPHFTMPVVTTSQIFWPYVSLTKAAVWDGTAHTDITRAAGDYTATDSLQWNGTIFGGVPILNNGNDVPQYWSTLNPATKMANLVNWPATLRAKVIRAFGPFLFAISLTDTGVQYPHRLRWSDQADPGTLPGSWDVSNPAVLAGEVDLPDVLAGVLVDALPLGSTLFLYKESSIWRTRFVGGQSVFDVGQSSWVTTSGLLGPRCVCISGDGLKHVLATQDDIIWHDGNTVNSILTGRQRKRLQNEIDTSNYNQSFIFANPFNTEIWFCYPSRGNTYPDKAIIMNYRTAGGRDWVVTEADGITFRNAVVGNVEAPNLETWDSGTDTWDGTLDPWSVLQRRRVVVSDPTSGVFLLLDDGTTRNGAQFTSTLQREGLALIGKKRNGDLVVDHQKMKMLKRMWPKVRGGSVNVRFGAQQLVQGATLWGTSSIFDPTTQVYVDPGIVSGRAVGIEFQATNKVWALDGYKIDMVPMGEF